MKSRKLRPENITKAFRRMTGTLSIQIDGKRWIDLMPTKENGQKAIDDFIIARNTGKLEYIEINEDKEIVDIKINNKKPNKKVLDRFKSIYRHG